MLLKIFFLEATSLIQSKTRKKVVLSYVNDKTVNVTSEVKVKIPLIGYKAKMLSLECSVDKIAGHDVYLHYSTGVFGGDMLLGGLLTLIPKLKKLNIFEKLNGTNIVVHLDKQEKIKNTLRNITLRSISFDRSSILIDFEVTM